MVAAMIKLDQNIELKSLGWKQILQIHDEIIFEGPSESAPQASKIVKKIMEDPLGFKLKIDLVVEVKIAKNWYEAK